MELRPNGADEASFTGADGLGKPPAAAVSGDEGPDGYSQDLPSRTQVSGDARGVQRVGTAQQLSAAALQGRATTLGW